MRASDRLSHLLHILFVATTTIFCSCWPTATFNFPSESLPCYHRIAFASGSLLSESLTYRHFDSFRAHPSSTYLQRAFHRISRKRHRAVGPSYFTMSSARKAGGGRKRRFDSLTSKDYARKLEAMKWRPDMTPAEQLQFKKKQRSLKNRLSALKSREKKRAQMLILERQVATLRDRVRELQKQNNDLRRGLVVPPHDPSYAAAYNDDAPKNPTKRQCTTYPLPSLDELYPEQPKLSDRKLEPCAHNSGSAVFTTRSSHIILAVQYSHMLWGMPWMTLRLTFLNLWTTQPRTHVCFTCKLEIKLLISYSTVISHRSSRISYTNHIVINSKKIIEMK